MLAALEPTGAQDQTGAVSTHISTSVRSAGMGTAGVAVFWGDDPVDWANPALLGDKRGLRYEWSRRPLLPGLADVHFTANRIVLGAGGLAMGLGGDPVDALGGYRLDYGVSQMTDDGSDQSGRIQRPHESPQLVETSPPMRAVARLALLAACAIADRDRLASLYGLADSMNAFLSSTPGMIGIEDFTAGDAPSVYVGLANSDRDHCPERFLLGGPP